MNKKSKAADYDNYDWICRPPREIIEYFKNKSSMHSEPSKPRVDYCAYYNPNSPKAKELRKRYSPNVTSEQLRSWTKPYFKTVLKDKWNIDC